MSNHSQIWWSGVESAKSAKFHTVGNFRSFREKLGKLTFKFYESMGVALRQRYTDDIIYTIYLQIS